MLVTQANGQARMVTQDSGAKGTHANFNVVVACTPTFFTLRGSVTGFVGGSTVTLYQGSDTIAASNGNFTFPTTVLYNRNFSASLVNPNS